MALLIGLSFHINFAYLNNFKEINMKKKFFQRKLSKTLRKIENWEFYASPLGKKMYCKDKKGLLFLFTLQTLNGSRHQSKSKTFKLYSILRNKLK